MRLEQLETAIGFLRNKGVKWGVSFYSMLLKSLELEASEIDQ